MEPGTDPDPFDTHLARPAPKPVANETWQRRWRIAGGVTIFTCAAMAFLGVEIQALHESKTLFLVYWGVFALLFFLTLYIVALDFRYIRAQHAIAARDLFQETLGDHEFRQALNKAMQEASEDESDPDTGKARTRD